MPDDSIDDALKEAYALAPSDIVILNTLQITHENSDTELFLLQSNKPLTLTLEDLTEQEFEAVGFRFSLPPKSDQGLQELTVAIDNVDLRISNFINTVKGQSGEVQVLYRPYLDTDLTQPLMTPPLLLYLKNISLTAIEIQGNATFADIINKRFPSEWYTRDRFPSLSNV